MPRKESRHAIRSECLSDQPVVQTGQPRLHLSESIWKPDAALRLPVSNLRFRRNSEFISELGCSWPATRSCEAAKGGGADRDRTDDLKLAKLALSQLSYGPDSKTAGLPTEAAEAAPVRLR